MAPGEDSSGGSGSPFKTREMKSVKNRANIKMLDKTAEFVGEELRNCIMKYEMVDNAEKKLEIIKETLQPLVSRKFLGIVNELVTTMQETGDASGSNPKQTASTLRNEVERLTTPENSGTETESSGGVTPPRKKKRKSRSPMYKDFSEALQNLFFTLVKLKSRARNLNYGLAERKRFAFLGLNAINAPRIIEDIIDLGNAYKVLVKSNGKNSSSSNGNTSDPSTSNQLNATPTDSPNSQGLNADALILANILSAHPQVNIVIEQLLKDYYEQATK